MREYFTPQEEFWAGAFGDEYINRNMDKQLLASNISLFSKIFDKSKNIKSILEFGPNIGLNLFAINQLLPNVELSGVEINENAANRLKDYRFVKVYSCSILDFSVDYQRDFVFTKGLLIHISPEHLAHAYKILYNSTSNYLCVVEYFNPKPVEIPYRGHRNRLFKRDFAGDLMKNYEDLQLIDYGFVYNGDYNFPQDDLTWFLMEKRK